MFCRLNHWKMEQDMKQSRRMRILHGRLGTNLRNNHKFPSTKYSPFVLRMADTLVFCFIFSHNSGHFFRTFCCSLVACISNPTGTKEQFPLIEVTLGLSNAKGKFVLDGEQQEKAENWAI